MSLKRQASVYNVFSSYLFQQIDHHVLLSFDNCLMEFCLPHLIFLQGEKNLIDMGGVSLITLWRLSGTVWRPAHGYKAGGQCAKLAVESHAYRHTLFWLLHYWIMSISSLVTYYLFVPFGEFNWQPIFSGLLRYLHGYAMKWTDDKILAFWQ